jgi:purine-nucleoside phosphorylase
VPEVIVARQMGLRVLGISLISNAAAGLSGETLNHEEVLTTAQEGAADFKKLLQGVLNNIAST